METNQELKKNNLIILISGLTGHSQDKRFVPIVEQLAAGLPDGDTYDVAVINYRGLSNATLSTPKMYCCYSIEDVIEPIKSVYKKYVQEDNRKLFVVGFSMGASILTNALSRMTEPEDPKIAGAIVINCPFRIWICYETSLSRSCCGLYNYILSKKYSDLYIDKEDDMKDIVKEKCDIDLRKTLQSMNNFN